MELQQELLQFGLCGLGSCPDVVTVDSRGLGGVCYLTLMYLSSTPDIARGWLLSAAGHPLRASRAHLAAPVELIASHLALPFDHLMIS